MGALIRIQHAIDSAKGLTVLSVILGLAKHSLAENSFDKLSAEEEKNEAALLIVIHHEISAAWLLKKIAVQLGVETPAVNKSSLIFQIL